MKIYCRAAMEANSVELSEVKIGKATTGIIVTQCQDAVQIDFGCGFCICIGERGITMRRDVLRPNHDHDDTQDLCVDTDGKLIWSWKYTPGHDRHQLARIAFGPVKVDY